MKILKKEKGVVWSKNFDKNIIWKGMDKLYKA